MDSEDVLSDDGRKALNSCVKIQTFSVPELQEYDRKTALERLRGCYGGVFPRGFDSWLLFDPLKLYDEHNGHNISEVKKYNIIVIYEALLAYDEVNYVEKYPKEIPGSENLKAAIEKRRADVHRESEEAKINPDEQRKYSWIVAQRRVRDCFAGNFAGDVGLLKRKIGERYTIIDISDAVEEIDNEGKLCKYPENEGNGCEELKKVIDANRYELSQERKDAEENPCKQREYSRSEAERRVRDCFAGSLKQDTDIFPSISKNREKNFKIIHIQRAIEYFDKKKLIEKQPKSGGSSDGLKVDNERANIRTEYEKANTLTAIEYGTGFIIHNCFIITNKHVIQRYLEDKEKYGDEGRYRLGILNEVINYLLSPTVVKVDNKNDLACIHCPKLNSVEKEIDPLRLSPETLLIGQSIFAFGYPITHTGATAFFVKGYISGYKEQLYRDPIVTMNASLTSGCSGGPVMRRINSEIMVLGVVKETHSHEIFDEDERGSMKSIMTFDKDKGPFYIKMLKSIASTLANLLFKLYNALTSTHTPFNYINVIPAEKVIDLINEAERDILENEWQGVKDVTAL